MKVKEQSNTSITKERAICLLNIMIGKLGEDEDAEREELTPILLSLGFTQDELEELAQTEESKERTEEAIDPSNFTLEYCPYCDTEQVIFAEGVTACPECGKPLAPCSMCEECDYETCPYGCTGGTEDEFKEVTNPPISKELAEKLYKLL